MGLIDRATVDRIYAAADIVEIIGDYVTLKRKGVNYQACCPFHNEKTPSFVVSPSKGVFKCFGCGKAGNAVTFVMEHEGISYPEALKAVAKRYGIDALGAMAQGLFASLLIGTIINTVGTQFGIGFLTQAVVTVGSGEKAVAYTVGGLASAMSGPAMACAIGYALQAPPLVLFSLITVGFASNALGGAGGPLAVLFVAILAAEAGKAVSKETKIDILVTQDTP